MFILVDGVHWRSISDAKRVVAHLEAPTAVRPVFGDVGNALVVKVDQLLHVLVSSQNVGLDALLKSRVGKDGAAGTESRFCRKLALINQVVRRLPSP